MTFAIGDKLRQAREERKVSLEQAAQQTRIRLRFLEALEKGELDSLPSATQARGFLRAYAQFLKIDPEPLLAGLRGEPMAEAAPGVEIAAAIVNPQATHAEAILADVGAKLRLQRELLGLSLEDVERHIHIRSHYLQALETGNLPGLPSPVQGRGMLSNYAIFLGCDPEPLLFRFAEGLQANLAARQAAQASAKPAKTRKSANKARGLRRFFSIDLLAGSFLVVFIIGFIIWGAMRISRVSSENEPTPTSPSIAEILAPNTLVPEPSTTLQPTFDLSTTPGTPDASQVTPTPGDSTQVVVVQPPIGVPQLTPTSTLPPFDASSVQVYVVIRQRAWVRVTVDGEIKQEGRVLPGSAYLFSGNELVVIQTGNAAALQVYFNQQDQGILGQFGEVIERAYSPSGPVQPTAVPTPLLTSTSPPEATPTPTPTPTSLP